MANPIKRSNPRRRTYTGTRAAAQPVSSLDLVLADVVAATIPEGKRPDEFTVLDYLNKAERMGRHISRRAALDALSRQEKSRKLTSRMVPVNGHTSRVWRAVDKSK